MARLKLRNLNKLIKHFEQLKEDKKPKLYYDQECYLDKNQQKPRDVFGSRCGTYACVAGHAVFVLAPEEWRRILRTRHLNGIYRIPEQAKELLGLDEVQADKLFQGDPLKIEKPTIYDALRVLRGLKKTGEVKWHL